MPREPKGDDLYERVLADLRARRDQLDRAIAAIEAVKAAGPLEEPGGVVPIRPDAFVGRTIVEAVKELLADQARPLKSGELAAGLKAGGLHLKSANPANTIGAVLMRRWKGEGDIVRVGRGTWALPEWRRDGLPDQPSPSLSARQSR
jgi:hypothetical protein